MSSLIYVGGLGWLLDGQILILTQLCRQTKETLHVMAMFEVRYGGSAWLLLSRTVPQDRDPDAWSWALLSS